MTVMGPEADRSLKPKFGRVKTFNCNGCGADGVDLPKMDYPDTQKMNSSA